MREQESGRRALWGLAAAERVVPPEDDVGVDRRYVLHLTIGAHSKAALRHPWSLQTGHSRKLHLLTLHDQAIAEAVPR